MVYGVEQLSWRALWPPEHAFHVSRFLFFFFFFFCFTHVEPFSSLTTSCCCLTCMTVTHSSATSLGQGQFSYYVSTEARTMGSCCCKDFMFQRIRVLQFLYDKIIIVYNDKQNKQKFTVLNHQAVRLMWAKTELILYKKNKQKKILWVFNSQRASSTTSVRLSSSQGDLCLY